MPVISPFDAYGCVHICVCIHHMFESLLPSCFNSSPLPWFWISVHIYFLSDAWVLFLYIVFVSCLEFLWNSGHLWFSTGGRFVPPGQLETHGEICGFPNRCEGCYYYWWVESWCAVELPTTHRMTPLEWRIFQCRRSVLLRLRNPCGECNITQIVKFYKYLVMKYWIALSAYQKFLLYYLFFFCRLKKQLGKNQGSQSPAISFSL